MIYSKNLTRKCTNQAQKHLKNFDQEHILIKKNGSHAKKKILDKTDKTRYEPYYSTYVLEL